MEDSAKLKRLLAVVLAVGNFLNEGTFSGAAEAITLESLLKLETVRCATKQASKHPQPAAGPFRFSVYICFFFSFFLLGGYECQSPKYTKRSYSVGGIKYLVVMPHVKVRYPIFLDL